MQCPKCENREFDASGICLICGYAALQHANMAQGEPEPPSPNAPGDLPEWRRELSRRLHEIRLKRDGTAAAQPDPEPSSGLLFPESEPQPAPVSTFPRPAPRPARKPRVAASAATRAVELRPVAAQQESETELPLFAAAEQATHTQAPEPPPPLAAPRHEPEPAPADQTRILALIDDAIATARGTTRTVREPTPPAPATVPVAPEPDRLILLSRTLSGLIDLLIVFLCASGFVLAAELISGIVIFDTRSAVNYALLLLAVHFVYSTFFLKTANQTIGMMITDLRVARLDGRRPGTRQILARSAAFLLSFLLLGIGLMTSLFDTHARCLHDAVSRTRVVRLS